MTYTQLGIVAVIVMISLDLWILRTRLVTRKIFWASYAIIVFFQLFTNGMFTGFGIVKYDGGRSAAVHRRWSPCIRAGRGSPLRLCDRADVAVVVGLLGAQGSAAHSYVRASTVVSPGLMPCTWPGPNFLRAARARRQAGNATASRRRIGTVARVRNTS